MWLDMFHICIIIPTVVNILLGLLFRWTQSLYGLFLPRTILANGVLQTSRSVDDRRIVSVSHRVVGWIANLYSYVLNIKYVVVHGSVAPIRGKLWFLCPENNWVISVFVWISSVILVAVQVCGSCQRKTKEHPAWTLIEMKCPYDGYIHIKVII